jgi:alanyl-tRNA synthetase
MQYLSTDAIRDRFQKFFLERGHHRLPSYPLVPINDNSLLLINSGMAPMKPYFTGQQIPPSKRVVTCQKCIRTNDIDEVGTDERHGSFFEMLGNFSFGDYFKKEIIPWAWEFLTVVMEVPKEKLYISVYEEDDEAYDIWLNDVGIPAERIYRLGKEDNFWEVGNGVGPCGPCSEIHFDRGVEFGCGKDTCAVGCDCDRFMEIWNLVFTQFNQTEDGRYEPLEQKNIDTGMGLERMAIVMQRAKGIFDIDTSKGIKDTVKALANENAPEKSLNIITDHIRSCVFMASDGVLPTNEGRGYVLRRLLRRAVRHGRLAGIQGAFVGGVIEKVIETYKDAYAALGEKEQHILLSLTAEEQRFLETIEVGLNLLQKYTDALKENGQTVLSGADAFKLYDTYGFPPEVTKEILENAGFTMDTEGFEAEMNTQRERARNARVKTDYMGAEKTTFHEIPAGLATEFFGYTESETEAEVLAIVADGQVTDKAEQGQSVGLVLSKTVLYAESGGQKGDSGQVRANGLRVTITDCKKVAGNNTAHIGVIDKGTISVGDKVYVSYDQPTRAATMRNHSATHLLQKALREVLGGHVEQAGSDVSSARLRFDFTNFAPLTQDERDKVEALVNEHILDALNVSIAEVSLDEARRQGAMALFGEKYGDTVRMVNMGGWSVELCGGTHVNSTAQIGVFKLMSETGVSSGVRRIEAVTGAEALRVYKEAEAQLNAAALAAKTPADKLAERVAALVAENKQLKKDIAKQSSGAADGNTAEELFKQAEVINGMTVVIAKRDDTGTDALRELADQIKNRLTSGVLFLCAVNDGAVSFIASATDDAVKKGINCGKLVKEAAVICGGNGGGRPNHAQAGGKDASKADEALAQVKQSIETIF